MNQEAREFLITEVKKLHGELGHAFTSKLKFSPYTETFFVEMDPKGFHLKEENKGRFADIILDFEEKYSPYEVAFISPTLLVDMSGGELITSSQTQESSSKRCSFELNFENSGLCIMINNPSYAQKVNRYSMFPKNGPKTLRGILNKSQKLEFNLIPEFNVVIANEANKAVYFPLFFISHSSNAGVEKLVQS